MTKEEIFEQIRLMLSQLFEIDKEEITLESKLFEELELDSIDAVDSLIVAMTQRRKSSGFT